MTDTELLESLIKKKGLKKKYIAECLGISTYALSLKITNKNEFKSGEIAEMCKLLKITSLRQKDKIFFAKKDDLKSSNTKGE